MPRQSRIDAPGALHHIIARGIGRRKVFDNDRAKARYQTYTFDKSVPSGKKPRKITERFGVSESGVTQASRRIRPHLRPACPVGRDYRTGVECTCVLHSTGVRDRKGLLSVCP